jgi:hypothetical protein
MPRLLPIIATAYAATLCAFGQPLTWTLPTPAAHPSAVIEHAMAYDSVRERVVLFGGLDFQLSATGATWEWDGLTWEQRANDGPRSRSGHGMAFDSLRGVTVLFGGRTGPREGETWEWNGATWLHRQVPGPSPRSLHAMAYDATRGVTVLFGGQLNFGESSETWEWNGTNWRLREVNGPSPRLGCQMVYDTRRHVCVLFGGSVGPALTNETWEWDGSTWALRATNGPSPRLGFAMAYDTSRSVTLVFGGYGSTANLGDTWEWNGTVWTQQTAPGPLARYGVAAAFHEAREQGVVFGGGNVDTGLSDETWLWQPDCRRAVITRQPVDQSAIPGGTVSFHLQATLTNPCDSGLQYHWERRNPAVQDPAAANAWIALEESDAFINTQTAALLVANPIPALATGYRCRIETACGCEGQPASRTYTNTVNFSVACPADFNADGGVDFQDVEAFFMRWENGC